MCNFIIITNAHSNLLSETVIAENITLQTSSWRPVFSSTRPLSVCSTSRGGDISRTKKPSQYSKFCAQSVFEELTDFCQKTRMIWDYEAVKECRRYVKPSWQYWIVTDRETDRRTFCDRI